jgi:hypothetical protein
MSNLSANPPDWLAASAEKLERHLQTDDFISARTALDECVASLREHTLNPHEVESVTAWLKTSIARTTVAREQLRSRLWSLPRQSYSTARLPAATSQRSLIL